MKQKQDKRVHRMGKRSLHIFRTQQPDENIYNRNPQKGIHTDSDYQVNRMIPLQFVGDAELSPAVNSSLRSRR